MRFGRIKCLIIILIGIMKQQSRLIGQRIIQESSTLTGSFILQWCIMPAFLDGLLFLSFNDNVYEEDNLFICYDYITDLLCV